MDKNWQFVEISKGKKNKKMMKKQIVNKYAHLLGFLVNIKTSILALTLDQTM